MLSPSSFSIESVIDAEMIGEAANTGAGFANTSLAAAFVVSPAVRLLTGSRLPPVPRVPAIAAIGVVRNANVNKQTINTLRLLGVASRDDLFTVIYFLR